MIQAEFSLDLLQSGLVVSSFSILAALFGVTLGILSRRAGVRLAGTVGLAATAAGAVMGTLALGFPLLLASRVLEGFGFLLAAVTMPGLINRVCPPRLRSVALGIWAAFIPAAMSLMLLASPVVLEVSGWRGLWWLSALVSLLVAVSFFALTGQSGEKPRAAAAEGSGRRDLARPLLVSGIFACYSALFAAVTAFLPTYWAGYRGMELGSSTYLASLVVIGNIVGNITAGYLVGRGMSLERLMRWALLGGGASAALAFSGMVPLAGEFAAAWMFTFLSGLLPGAVFAHIGTISPSTDSVPMTTGMIFQGGRHGPGSRSRGPWHGGGDRPGMDRRRGFPAARLPAGCLAVPPVRMKDRPDALRHQDPAGRGQPVPPHPGSCRRPRHRTRPWRKWPPATVGRPAGRAVP